jgi:hypothetical protein
VIATQGCRYEKESWYQKNKSEGAFTFDIKGHEKTRIIRNARIDAG